MKPLCLLSMMFISISLFACNNNHKGLIEQNTPIKDSMKIRMIVDDNVFTATLYDNLTSKDFVSLLPLTLTLTDYNNTEKISYLPKKLTTQNAPLGYKPSAGDLTIYAPWGNLALFYKGFGYSEGLVSLGKLDHGIEVFNRPGSVQVKIELIQ